MQTQMLTDPNQRAFTVKNQGITEISVGCSKNSENKLKIFKIILETETVTPTTLFRIVMSTLITTTTKTVTEPKESQKLFIHPVRHVERHTIPQKKCYHGANAANRPPPRQGRPKRQNQVPERANQNDSNETTQAAARNLN